MHDAPPPQHHPSPHARGAIRHLREDGMRQRVLALVVLVPILHDGEILYRDAADGERRLSHRTLRGLRGSREIGNRLQHGRGQCGARVPRAAAPAPPRPCRTVHPHTWMGPKPPVELTSNDANETKQKGRRFSVFLCRGK